MQHLRRALLALTAIAVALAAVFATGLHRTALDAIAGDCNSKGSFHRNRAHRADWMVDGVQHQACKPHARAMNRRGRLEQYDFELQETDEALFPYIVDSNSPAFRSDAGLRLFNSAWEETYVSAGDSPLTLSEPLRVELPNPGRPGAVWIESVWRDPATNVLYGWYHFEPADLFCMTAPVIGAAVSYDYGATWEDRGQVMEPAYGIDCDYDNGYFSGGNGDFSVVLDREGKYFYFLFTSYAGPPTEQGIGVARSLAADRGQPGTLFKYFNGGWDQPAMGGRFTPVFKTSTGWKGPYVESYWGPSVHWNTYLNAYVVLMNHTAGEFWAQEGVYLAFSRDLVHWSEPRKILDADAWYPQVMGLGDGETDSLAGETSRIYVGGVSTFTITFRAPAG